MAGPEAPRAVAALEPLALERLLALGGPTLVAEMTDLFIEHGSECVEAALRAARASDLPAARRAAHSLGTTAGTLGASALQQIAGDIENLSDGEGGSLPALGRELELRFAEAVRALEHERRRLSE